MLILLKNITRNLSLFVHFVPKRAFGKNISSVMNEVKIKRTRYDGRSKKRNWEERRTDKGESIGLGTKKAKTGTVVEVPVEKIIDKIKRRKFVLLMGYSGVNYLGMQRNHGRKTIEEELFQALKNLNYVTSIDFEQVQNISFQRAARTDKGVSAARQIVSLKLPENLNIDKINDQLPDDIRVFGYKRVTKGFNSKSQCDSRTYTYMLPTVAFANQNETVSQNTYRIDSGTLNKINELLKNFVGTKNFHNYTSKKKPTDPSAKRYMMSFVCEEPFIRKNVEFAVLKVRGQSFMLHQIRKMVGTLLAVVRGFAPTEIIAKSFTAEKVCIPRAPGLGLVLDYVHYDRYDERYGADGIHEKITWEHVEDKVNEFKEKYIYPTIINKEIEEENILWWLQHKLSKHSYDDADNYDSDDNGGDDDDEDGNEKHEETIEENEDKRTNINSNVDENINKIAASS